jgi:hypothetical protein
MAAVPAVSLVFGALARATACIEPAGYWPALSPPWHCCCCSRPARHRCPVDADPHDAPRRLAESLAANTTPADIACRELVGLLSDHLDGVLDPTWRARIDAHLRDCDGCTAYHEQIRATVDLLAQLDKLTEFPIEDAKA